MRVGFIGVGNMGGPMASNVLKAGFDLRVHDVRADVAAKLAAEGAEVGATPADVAADADVVDIVVMDGAQVEAVTLGDAGVLSSARPGTVIAVHSTVHPSTVRRVADAAAPRGVDVIDAPISGGVVGATAGTLCVMVGGDAAAFERARPVFDACGALVLHLGPLGAGLGAKLARNLIGYVSMLGAQEGVALADRAGVDHERMLQICEHTGVLSWQMRELLNVRGPHPTYGDDLGPLVELSAKDMRAALALAADVGIELPAGQLTLDRIRYTVVPPDAPTNEGGHG